MQFWFKIRDFIPNINQNWRLLKSFYEKYQIFWWNFWFYACDQKLLLVTVYVKSYLTHPIMGGMAPTMLPTHVLRMLSLFIGVYIDVYKIKLPTAKIDAVGLTKYHKDIAPPMKKISMCYYNIIHGVA